MGNLIMVEPTGLTHKMVGLTDVEDSSFTLPLPAWYHASTTGIGVKAVTVVAGNLIVATFDTNANVYYLIQYNGISNTELQHIDLSTPLGFADAWEGVVDITTDGTNVIVSGTYDHIYRNWIMGGVSGTIGSWFPAYLAGETVTYPQVTTCTGEDFIQKPQANADAYIQEGLSGYHKTHFNPSLTSIGINYVLKMTYDGTNLVGVGCDSGSTAHGIYRYEGLSGTLKDTPIGNTRLLEILTSGIPLIEMDDIGVSWVLGDNTPASGTATVQQVS